MTVPWRPVTGVVAVVAVLEAGAFWSDTEPRPLLLAAVAISGCALAWTLKGLAEATSGAPLWPSPRPEPDVGTDWQIAALRSGIALGAESAGGSDRVHRALVALVDDRLAAEHGIDRRARPDAARAVLGDELHRFVTDTENGRRLRRPRDLERIVSLIETTPAEEP